MCNPTCLLSHTVVARAPLPTTSRVSHTGQLWCRACVQFWLFLICNSALLALELYCVSARRQGEEFSLADPAMRSLVIALLTAAAMLTRAASGFTLTESHIHTLVAASRKAPTITTKSLYVHCSTTRPARFTDGLIAAEAWPHNRKPRTGCQLCSCMALVTQVGVHMLVQFPHNYTEPSAGSNPGMQSLAKSVSDAYPGMYSISVNVANGFESYVTPMWQQVDAFAAIVQNDPKLASGFNAAGLSQGGPVVRGYIQKYNNPPVHNFVSICGVQGGEFNCPREFQEIPFLCDYFLKDPYSVFGGGITLAFSDYWVDSLNMTQYLAENKFLVPLNNQQRDPSLHNATFKTHFSSLNHLVLIEAVNDTVIYPAVSEQFGGYIDGSMHVTYKYTTWPPYTSDSFGLRSLDEAGKVTLGSFQGDHLQFTTQYWDSHVLPWFNTTLP